MKCNNRIVVTTTRFRDEDRKLLLYLDEHNHPIEIHTQLSDAPSYVGNIYIARVSQVMEQMNAAFLQAGNLKFFYPLEPIDSVIFTKKTGNPTYLCQGDELVVQVVRDAIKSKEICVSTNALKTNRTCEVSMEFLLEMNVLMLAEPMGYITDCLVETAILEISEQENVFRK